VSKPQKRTTLGGISIDESDPLSIINIPIDWNATWNLAKQARAIRLLQDQAGNIIAFPMFLVDPTSNPIKAGGGNNPLTVQGPYVSPGVGTVFWAHQSWAFQALSPNPTPIWTNAAIYLYKPDPTTPTMETPRTPSVYKTLGGANAAGLSTVWTPGAGKKFRLMAGVITLTKDTACAGALWVALVDNVDGAGTRIVRFEISGAALVATGQVIVLPFTIPGNGILSSTVNNVLALNLGGALTAGLCSVTVWGTEE
jgi:hypothetical protein